MAYAAMNTNNNLKAVKIIFINCVKCSAQSVNLLCCLVIGELVTSASIQDRVLATHRNHNDQYVTVLPAVDPAGVARVCGLHVSACFDRPMPTAGLLHPLLRIQVSLFMA